MGSAEESRKFASLYDPPSSPTQPLLSKLYPSPSPIGETNPYSDPTTAEPDQSQYIQISYNYGPRPIKDLLFFILFVLSTFAFGIFSAVKRNPNSSSVSSFVYDSDATSFVKDSLSYSLSSFDRNFFVNSLCLCYSSSALEEGLIWTLVITMISSAPFVLRVLGLLKQYTKQIVYVCLPFFVLIPVCINVYWFAACTVNSTCSDEFPLAYRILVLVFVFLVIGVLVWIIVVNWHRIELTVRIIGIASHARWTNLRLFGVLPCLTLGLAVYYVPTIVFLVFANGNGKIVPREKGGEYLPCLEAGQLGSRLPLAILTMLWSAAATVEAQVYAISGTIGQWNFCKDDSAPRKSIRNSLRNAFGSLSGTVCLSGFYLFVLFALCGLRWIVRDKKMFLE